MILFSWLCCRADKICPPANGLVCIRTRNVDRVGSRRKGKTMKARLAIYKGSKVDLAFPLTEAVTVIGRDANNMVQLPHPRVSKRHALVHAKGNKWTIEDAESTNGITVNGARVKRADLKDGDRINIGPFELVFEAAATGDWVPSHVIEMSSEVTHRTISQAPDSLPGKSGGTRRV